MPELLAIVSQDAQYSPHIQRRALQVVHTVFCIPASVSGLELKQVQGLLGPMLAPWTEQLGRIIGSNTDPQVRLHSPILVHSTPLSPVKTADHMQLSILATAGHGRIHQCTARQHHCL